MKNRRIDITARSNPQPAAGLLRCVCNGGTEIHTVKYTRYGRDDGD